MLKYLKKNNFDNKEIKNAWWLIAGRITQMIISFFISIITARYLGPNNYGIINYGTAYVTFFMSFCTLGINSIIIKDFVDHPKEQGKTIGTTLLLRIVSSSISILMIICSVSIIDKNEPLTISVTVLCAMGLVFQVFDTINYWFQSLYLSKITSMATLLAYLITSIYKIILFLLNKDIRWFAFASSIDYIFLALFLYIVYKKYHGPKLSFSWEKGKYLLSKSYHYILSGMMVAIYGQTDKLMLKHMLNETSVGYFSLASSINSMWVFVLSAIIDSMYPTIVRLSLKNKDEFDKKNRQLYALIIYISIFVAFIFMCFGKIAIKIIYGEAYFGAANPLKIITWYTIFAYLGVARNSWIVCENKQKYLKYMYLSAAIINIVLNYILIPVWGASGAAFASLITQIMTCILLPALIKNMRPNAKLIVEAFLLKKMK